MWQENTDSLQQVSELLGIGLQGLLFLLLVHMMVYIKDNLNKVKLDRLVK